MRPRPIAGPLDGFRGVVLGVDIFDDPLERVDLADLGPHERARLADRLRQILAELDGPPAGRRLH